MAAGLQVRAWRKQGEAGKLYDTRLVGDLAGLDRQEPALSRWGGLAGEPVRASGFFRAERLGDRWWLIDPDGHRYLHVAVNSVAAGRGPTSRKAFADRFGTPEQWRDQTVAWLRDLGFNGTGCWSNDALLRTAADRLTYCPQWNFMASYGKLRGGTWQKPGHTGYPNDCIFCFDEGFRTFCDEHARRLAPLADDPWLLGHFSDNELPFPGNLLDKALQLGAEDPTRREATRWLAALGKQPGAQTDEDRRAWKEHVGETYFRTVNEAIKRFDPHHLYLGSRLHGSDATSGSIWRAAGRHVDVVAMNVYGVWTPTTSQIGQWTTWSGKPVMATEWYAKGADSGLANTTGAGWTVATQADRGRFYQAFVLGLLESRGCVGWHWFKYLDNDPLDLSTDPSNRDSNKGMLTAAYEPWPPLLEAMRELNRLAYPITAWFDRQL